MPFTYSYDLTTDVGKVRLLISDVDLSGAYENTIFADQELEAMLDLESGDVRLGAALALETIARNEVMVSKVIRVLDLQTDGAAVARELRMQAQELRAQAADAADAASDDLGFDIAEVVVDQFTWRDRLWNEGLRGA